MQNLEQQEEEGPAPLHASPATVHAVPGGWTQVLPEQAPVQQAPGSDSSHAVPVC